MFVQVISRMCLWFSFYVLGVFLLSADVKTYCDGFYFCYKEYLEDFKSGSISHISFRKRDMTEVSREQLRVTIMRANEEYGKAIEAGYPDYSLEFKIVGEHQAVNIKQVIFDGVEAEPSIFHIFEPSWQLAEIKDFQMEPVKANSKLAEVISLVPVSNTFTIRLRKRLVDKLKEKPRIKITLISSYGKKFIIETDNFIREYDF
ncbi:hypothetical protein A7978_04720 (plasmid) [Borrelia turicatae]|nr:hypothetical protein [Borrelia turicatae]ANF34416.1 hypothetical protein A7978_04720 [Borrelia turicatae]UPA14000.1 hypothetical protein bt91E135_001164 [Borrelia turicatae 91E135]UPA15493.1 hypothetical protein btBTE5EL_001175 [Borrelia turicatae]